MASKYWSFVLQMIPGTLAKAEDINANLSGVDTGFVLVEADLGSSIKIVNETGVVEIPLSAASRANKLVSFDINGDVVASTNVGDYKGAHAAAAGTQYYVRDIVKDSTAAIGQDNIYICMVDHVSTGDLAADIANWEILIDAAAAANSAAAALQSELNAAATYAAFDARELGSKSADPVTDNIGGVLLISAQYWNTVEVQKKIWTGASWIYVTAQAINVGITDSAGIYDSAHVEGALARVGLMFAPPLTASVDGAVYTVSLGITALQTGMVYRVRFNTKSLSTFTFLNIDGTGNKAIRHEGSLIGVEIGALAANYIADLYYDGTVFRLLNPYEHTEPFTVVLRSGNGNGTTTFTTSEGIETIRGYSYKFDINIAGPTLTGMTGLLQLEGMKGPEDFVTTNRLRGCAVGGVAGMALATPVAVGGLLLTNQTVGSTIPIVQITKHSLTSGTTNLLVSDITTSFAINVAGRYELFERP